MAKKRVSLRDVAREAGVSVATASRVVAGKGSVSEESRRLVMDAVRTCGYVLEPHDDDTDEQGSPFVGMVAYTCDNELYAQVTDLVSTGLADRGRYLSVLDCSADASREEDAVRQLQHMGATAIILMGARSENFAIENGDVPFLLVSASPISTDALWSVSSDDYVGGRLAAQELLRKGCAAPIVLSNRWTPIGSNRRVRGFVDAFAEAGIVVDEGRLFRGSQGRPSALDANELVAYLWAKGVTFDSVFACNDWRAYGALSALETMGVDVPGQVKIVGYDGTRISRYGSRPITTIQQDGQAIANATLGMLDAIFAGEEPRERRVTLPVRLVPGQTT